MKLRWKISLGLVALAIIGALLLANTPNRAQQDLEATRRSLRQQGFKLDLSEFNLSISPELSRRAARLATTTRAALTNRTRPGPILNDATGLVTPAGTNSALVTWKLKKVRSYRTEDLWQELRETLNTNRARLDAALEAALSGPIRFEPIGSEGPNPMLPYLADLKNLETTFAMNTVLALHDGHEDEAWTNLLASTCLVTSYTPEPIEMSHLVRYACAAIAFETAWNALQTGNWTDGRLADLQRRWESVDFWSGLPETAAWARADMSAAFKLDRQEPLDSGNTLKEMLRSPRRVWPALTFYWRQVRYRHQGTYEDEKALLLYCRDHEIELRRAVPCPNWSEMRQLQGVTNMAPSAASSSRSARRLRMQQMNLIMQSQGRGLLGRAAEAEARRRLTITAIALERFHGRHGSYPKSLQELVPELLSAEPTDFMDGKPLRYYRTDDGHFMLYSVGLDCVDNGGEWRRPRPQPDSYEVASGLRFAQGADLVWPRPASDAEAERLHQEEHQAQERSLVRLEETQAAEQWDRTARRQAQVETILKARQRPIAKNPVYRGRPLVDLLRNSRTSGTNKLTLTEMLTLNPIITGAEPEVVTFELPISYDALTNLGTLELYIDPTPDEDSDEGCNVGQLDCNRATNGNCLLVWNTIYEAPGKHALQAGLDLNEPPNLDEEISGPLAVCVVTNLCQFSLSSAHFQRDFGATLRVRLPEPNGTYNLQVKSPAGALLKTLTGNTSNSFLNVHWDLTDDHGNLCTNDSYDTIFQITLPLSGRSQTLRGP
jgi:hypothetical protein